GVGGVDMGIDLATDADPGEGAKRSVLAADRHMAHAPSGLLREPEANHLVIRKGRAVEEEKMGARDPSQDILAHLRAAGNIDQSCVGGTDFEPERRFTDAPDADR